MRSNISVPMTFALLGLSGFGSNALALEATLCTDKSTPQECYEAGLMQVGEAQAQLRNLTADLQAENKAMSQRFQDRYDALIANLHNPRQISRDCPPTDGNCETPECAANELLIGGGCLLPGEEPNGTGYVQNFGNFDRAAWHCTMGNIPTLPVIKKIRAIAWCAKLP